MTQNSKIVSSLKLILVDWSHISVYNISNSWLCVDCEIKNEWLSYGDSYTDLQRPHQNVVRFEVTEDDALPVKVCQSCYNLIGYSEG